MSGFSNFVDESGVTRLRAKGGGSPTQQETVTSPGAACASSETIPWAHDSGATLLDYSDPDFPVVIAAGTYALAVYGTIDATDATAIRLVLGLPVSSITSSGPVVAGVSDFGQVEVSAVVVLAAGDSINLSILHDNTGSPDCGLAGYVVKLA